MKEINVYLTFDGNAREAMQFYAKALGAKLQLMTFGQMPDPNVPKEAKNKVMHARLSKGALAIMASDTMPGMPFTKGNNFSVSVACGSAKEAERLFKAFSEKGAVTMPLQKTFWADRFGALTDKFGVNWMFNFEGKTKNPMG